MTDQRKLIAQALRTGAQPPVPVEPPVDDENREPTWDDYNPDILANLKREYEMYLSTLPPPAPGERHPTFDEWYTMTGYD